uniref:Aldehyde dehydrogenase domain-containing protein n=1 Tax=Hucho hucho TaxID=62062 RepID=A0A4W5LHB8_9TELE
IDPLFQSFARLYVCELFKALPLETCKALLRQLRAMLRDNEAPIAAALGADLHQPAHETFLAEIGLILAEIQTHLDYMDDWSAPKYTCTSFSCFPGRSSTLAEPLGVVCIFDTWKHPLHVTLLPLVGAISTGICAVDGSVDATNAVLAKLMATYLDTDLVRGGLEVSKDVLAQRFNLIFCTGGTFPPTTKTLEVNGSGFPRPSN